MAPIDMNAILNQIRENVRLRRIAGEYPPGLENQLEQEFELIMQSTNRVFGVDVEAKEHIEDADSALKRLISRYETQKENLEKQSLPTEAKTLALDPWGFIAPELVEIEHHVLVTLRLLIDHAVNQQEADKRLVKELSQHVLDRLAVVDHLALLVQELESRIRDLEKKKIS
jgi:hypothetical protein